jgi:hypothetical protein
MNRGSLARLSGYALIVVALVVTLRVNLTTLAHIVRARTSVPWADQWVIVQDVMRRQHGEPLWPIVWTPYWGHRLVIPRLLFLADAHWLSLASLTWLTMLLQFVHIGLLLTLAWLLLGKRSPALFMIAIAVILNLMLSPFQMENFTWGMQTMFPLVFVAATAAFLCLQLGSVAFCIALGLISSLTMPNGILVWPVLAIQAVYLKQSRRVITALAAIGAAVIAAYLWHYVRPPELGMGAVGILRHPIDSIMLLGLIVGSPFRFTIPSDVVVGILTLAVTGYLVIRANKQKWFSALFAIVLFSFLSSLSLVAGRLTPQALHVDSRDPLPGRYFTMICLLWVSIGLLALCTVPSQRHRAWLFGFYGILLAGLMFASVRRQLIEADDWADFFLGTDAAGSGFLVNAPDEQLLSILWPAKAEREERVEFLRQQSLALFHETRAAWMGKRVADLFPPATEGCIGAIEKKVNLDASSWRVQGWAWNPHASTSPDDILLTDATGRIIGLGRGGLRHGYIPGLLIEPEPVPLSHARFRRSEWLGYVRQSGDTEREQVKLYGAFRSDGKVCAIE